MPLLYKKPLSVTIVKTNGLLLSCTTSSYTDPLTCALHPAEKKARGQLLGVTFGQKVGDFERPSVYPFSRCSSTHCSLIKYLRKVFNTYILPFLRVLTPTPTKPGATVENNGLQSDRVCGQCLYACAVGDIWVLEQVGGGLKVRDNRGRRRKTRRL